MTLRAVIHCNGAIFDSDKITSNADHAFFCAFLRPFVSFPCAALGKVHSGVDCKIDANWTTGT
jgi:hypothetical protein